MKDIINSVSGKLSDAFKTNFMEFEFGKYTEITDLAFRVNKNYKKEGYVRFFICADVWDFWFCRIMKGVDENYEHDSNSFVLERNKIPMDKKGERLTVSKVKKIIEDDDGSGWDMQQSYDINELIEMVDGGWGILNLAENN